MRTFGFMTNFSVVSGTLWSKKKTSGAGRRHYHYRSFGGLGLSHYQYGSLTSYKSHCQYIVQVIEPLISPLLYTPYSGCQFIRGYSRSFIVFFYGAQKWQARMAIVSDWEYRSFDPSQATVSATQSSSNTTHIKDVKFSLRGRQYRCDAERLCYGAQWQQKL